MPWSVREGLCLLVAAAGFEPAAQQLLSDESLSHVVDLDRVCLTREEIVAKWDSMLDVTVHLRAGYIIP